MKRLITAIIGSSLAQTVKAFAATGIIVGVIGVYVALLSWNVSSYDFGSVSQGTMANYSTTLHNTGNAPAYPTFSGMSTTVFTVYSTPIAIAAGSSTKIKYHYFANDTSTHTGHLHVSYSGGPDAVLTLTGTGTATSSTEYLVPTSAANAAMSNSGGTATQVLSDGDISCPESDTTYAYTSTSSTGDRMQMASSSADTITAVRLCICAKTATGNTTGVRLRWYNGSTFQPAADNIHITTTSVAKYCSGSVTNNPYTSSLWTASELNALTTVVYSPSTFPADTLYVYRFWTEVNP